MNENFIQSAIKHKGALTAYAKEHGMMKGDKIDRAKIRTVYNRLREKSKRKEKLSIAERTLLRRIALYLNVLLKGRR